MTRPIWERRAVERRRVMVERGLVGGLLFVVAFTTVTLAFGFADVRGEEDWRNLYLDAKPVLDVRYRFEFVDQDGKVVYRKLGTIDPEEVKAKILEVLKPYYTEAPKK